MASLSGKRRDIRSRFAPIVSPSSGVVEVPWLYDAALIFRTLVRRPAVSNRAISTRGFTRSLQYLGRRGVAGAAVYLGGGASGVLAAGRGGVAAESGG